MADRAHLSIGEVLSLLQEEFPDVTISKIRFLESQGLLDPERTPSGYRKFYEVDIERLRWILRQQKDNFLPLRVIKDRLEGLEDDVVEPEPVEEHRIAPALTPLPAPERPAAPVVAAEPAPVAPTPLRPLPSSPKIFEQLRTPAAEVDPEPGPAPELPSVAPSSFSSRTGPLDAGPSAVSLTTDELAAAAGVSDKLLAELERYSLITGRPMGRETVYDEEALVVARLAGAFAAFGVEARHLRMYKVAAEREASFFEQVVLPLLKQRNPSARRQALANLSDLASLGESLRGAMLRNALRGYTAP
jgi:DNA-binding transcriptional MerR regulator